MKLEDYWKVHPIPRRLNKAHGQPAKHVIVIKGPFEVTIACENSKPSDDDMKYAQWCCNALNWAKQRTEEILEENFGPDNENPKPSDTLEEYKKAVDEIFGEEDEKK